MTLADGQRYMTFWLRHLIFSFSMFIAYGTLSVPYFTKFWVLFFSFESFCLNIMRLCYLDPWHCDREMTMQVTCAIFNLNSKLIFEVLSFLIHKQNADSLFAEIVRVYKFHLLINFICFMCVCACVCLYLFFYVLVYVCNAYVCFYGPSCLK